METICLSLVDTGSRGNLFLEIPGSSTNRNNKDVSNSKVAALRIYSRIVMDIYMPNKTNSYRDVFFMFVCVFWGEGEGGRAIVLDWLNT